MTLFCPESHPRCGSASILVSASAIGERRAASVPDLRRRCLAAPFFVGLATGELNPIRSIISANRELVSCQCHGEVRDPLPAKWSVVMNSRRKRICYRSASIPYIKKAGSFPPFLAKIVSSSCAETAVGRLQMRTPLSKFDFAHGSFTGTAVNFGFIRHLLTFLQTVDA